MFYTTTFRFTGKELDAETGNYYYGARYLDPRTSRWLSTDPAIGEYIPGAPINDEVRKRNGNLPGMGGVFNVVNFHLYNYAGNNPVKYTDPDGKKLELIISKSQGTLTMNRYYHETDRSTVLGIVPTFFGIKIDVVTNVVNGAGVSKSSIASDINEIQSSSGGYTNPTQLANGVYGITEARAPTTGNGTFGTGEQGLYINATQLLPGVDFETKERNGNFLKDTGYMIHITPYNNTKGCIGIKYKHGNASSKSIAVAIMESLVVQYKAAVNNGEKVIVKIVE